MIPDLSKRIEELAVTLTGQLSVLDTPDELKMSQLVYDLLGAMPYFQAHPENLRFVEAKNDKLGRRSVMAVVRGEKDPANKRTVVCIGHTDTVGISDFGMLKEYANQPYELTEKFKEIRSQLTAECRRDLDSGDYLFGRGIFDMKTGDAVLMALIEYITADIQNFSGNIIFVAVCDEEGGSAGMLSAVSELRKFQDSGEFDLRALLDTDYMTSEYEGDENKYVYIGTVGKLLPAFYVVGKETHVGESFKGLDPNQIAAAITQEVNLNPDYCDVAEGEVTLPPVTLRQQDLKPEYSVQTAKTALIYFNYATHCSTPDQVMGKLLGAAEKGMAQTIETLQARFDRFNEMTGRPKQVLPWKPRALSFDELYQKVRAERGEVLDQQVRALAEKLAADDTLDSREKSLKIVELVHGEWSDRDPVVIVCFFPPYYPHIYVEGKREKERELLEAAQKTVSATKSDYRLVWKKFFPYISDLSYAAAPSDPKIVAALRDNMPGFGTIYDLPLEDMQALNLPVLDIGVFGKDAHKFTERLEKKYSFTVTPELVYRTIINLL
ncbi:MAG: M20/M25/M40 family metallo-hydrolase [Clostridiaceae bacterium]|nr:M20/M25/M40 family metallo-hydrolase [Clostridiaceae bacterium]